VTNTNLRQLRYTRTRASNRVRDSVRWMLAEPTSWALNGDPVGPDFQGLPSWWPFWSDTLKKQVIAAVRAARQLSTAEIAHD